MPAFAPITVHESQWPEVLASQLAECLRCRRLNHKFHYDSHRQVLRWLRLHEAYSPARRVEEFRETYVPAFEAAVDMLGSDDVHVIGLGCGGAQKEAALLERLSGASRQLVFTATDVSSGMVVTALQAAWPHLDPSRCSALVCDLVEASDLDEFLDAQAPSESRRVVTFFGIIPNFEPEMVQRLLSRVLRPGDLLLTSANLAPVDRHGGNYQRGIEEVLPQYDNALTRQWLFTLLQDLGVGVEDGSIRFLVEESPESSGFRRIRADYAFQRAVELHVESETVALAPGESLRLFYSYRHTRDTVDRLFRPIGLQFSEAWISPSGEEGVFLTPAR